MDDFTFVHNNDTVTQLTTPVEIVSGEYDRTVYPVFVINDLP